MELNKMSKEELEVLSHTDLTELILNKENKPMNTLAIFKTISKLLGYSDEECANKIGDYYASLATDKRFHFLEETAEWDLRKNHSVNIVLEEDEDSEEVEEDEENNEEEDINELDEIDVVIESDDLDDKDDDLEDLNIVSEDDMDED